MSRTSIRSGVAFAAATALAVTGLGLAAGGPAAAASGTYTEPSPVAFPDQSFARNNASALTIPVSGPTTPYGTSVTVAGNPDTVTDVNVTLRGLTHTDPADLDIMLVGPTGQRVMLLSDSSNSSVSGVSFTVDDQAAATAPNPLAGTFKPTNLVGSTDTFPAPAPDASLAGTSLAVFNGASPNGTWSLYVVDNAPGDSGSLAGGWTLSITTNGPSPHVANPYASTLSVAGALKGITDVNVVLNGFTHTWPDDLDVLLVGPGGQMAKLMSDVGGSGDVSGLSLTFDDEAASLLPDATTLLTGSYRPTDFEPGDGLPAPAPVSTSAGTSLSVFDNTNPNGTWSLYVNDDSAGDDGFISGWSLQISTVDAPVAPVLTAPAAGTRDRDGAFTVAGSAPAGETVTVLVDGVAKGAATTSAIGQWAAPVSGVHNGTHAVTATATDGFGNVSAPSAVRSVIVDSVKPTVVSTVPVSKAKHASTTANVKAKTSEAVRRLTVTKAHAFIVVAGTTKHLKAKITWKAGTHRIVINPKADLAHGTTYKVTITTKVLDLAGNPLDQNKSKAGVQKKTWKFTTK
jgi:subtilisin-like proprotein convertase family protein